MSSPGAAAWGWRCAHDHERCWQAMTALPVDPDELVALGAFTGAQVLVVCFSVIIANAYRERALLLHGWRP